MAKILVVDDEAECRVLLQRSFEDAGHEVRTAEDGAAGLGVLREWDPDLTVTDLLMPVMDGFELLRRARAGGATDVPVVLMSGAWGEEEAAALARAGGAARVLAKPFGLAGIRQLLALVDSLPLTPRVRDAPAAADWDDEHRRLLGGKLYAKVAELEATNSALRRAEESLRASEAQLRALAARSVATREEESARIAREIHDELGQALTALKFDVAALRAGAEPAAGARLDRMSAALDRTLAAMRRLCGELRPAMLDSLGLPAALEWQVREFEASTGVLVNLRLPARESPCAGACATAVFRIFQEILTNVARHADATEVNVRLESTDGWLTLEAADNGRGFNPPADGAPPRGLGLLGMRERALAAGGRLEIESRLGTGVTVTLRVPEGEACP